MTRQQSSNSKVEQSGSTMATIIIASSLARKTRDSTTVGFNRACSDGRSRENRYSDSTSKLAGRVCTSARPIYHRGGL